MVRFTDSKDQEWSLFLDGQAVEDFERATGEGFFAFAFKAMKVVRQHDNPAEGMLEVAESLMSKFSVTARLMFHAAKDKDGQKASDYESFRDAIFPNFLKEGFRGCMKMIFEYFPDDEEGVKKAVPFHASSPGSGKT